MSKFFLLLIVACVCCAQTYAREQTGVDMIIKQHHYDELQPTDIATCGYDDCFRLLSDHSTQRCRSTEGCCEKSKSHCLYTYVVNDIQHVSRMTAEYPWDHDKWGVNPAFERKCVNSPGCVQDFIDKYRNVNTIESVKKKLKVEAEERTQSLYSTIYIIFIVVICGYIFL